MTKSDKMKFENLKREIAVGIEALEQGRFESYTSENIMQLADEASRLGKQRLQRRASAKIKR